MRPRIPAQHASATLAVKRRLTKCAWVVDSLKPPAQKALLCDCPTPESRAGNTRRSGHARDD
eukprot:5168900-Alexandrium_andersonii.AAC.1